MNFFLQVVQSQWSTFFWVELRSLRVLKKVDVFLAGIAGCSCFLDNTIIYVSKTEEKDPRLHAVSERLELNGIVANFEKPYFLKLKDKWFRLQVRLNEISILGSDALAIK